jgi:hypothetical protein
MRGFRGMRGGESPGSEEGPRERVKRMGHSYGLGEMMDEDKGGLIEGECMESTHFLFN